MTVHHFSVEVATIYGFESAVLLNNINFWIQKNKANGTAYHDGYYWTYNSVKAFNELFPYMTEKKIRSALKTLKDEGLLITGNYNKQRYDHTKWYALTEYGEMVANGKIEPGTKPEAKTESTPEPPESIEAETEPPEEPQTDIPDQPQEKPQTNRHTEEVKEIVAYLNDRTGAHYRTSESTSKPIRARLNEGFTVSDFKKVIDNKTEAWGNDSKMEKYLRPQTLFGTKFEAYLNEKGRNNDNRKNEFKGKDEPVQDRNAKYETPAGTDRNYGFRMAE